MADVILIWKRSILKLLERVGGLARLQQCSYDFGFKPWNP
jgi:hypothetical protein